jgi:hypothetical protein
MALPAAKWAAQIHSAGTARMSEKPNPAVNTVGDTLPQLRIGLQYRVQRGLILADKRLSAIVLVPIFAKREELLDRDDKKARLSVTMRSVSFTPSSYLIDAKAPRGRARFFVQLRRARRLNQHNQSTTEDSLSPFIPPRQRRLATPHILKRLLGRKKIVNLSK